MQIVVRLFGIVIAITAVSIACITWKARRRSRKISQVARSLGLSYQPDGAALLNDGWAELPIFALAAFGKRETVSNVIAGNLAGAAVTACDCAYWTGSVNTQRRDYAQTVACFRLEPNCVPSFTLYPVGGMAMNLARGSAGMLAAIAKPIAGEDGRWQALESVMEREREDLINIDGDPEFSKQHRLTGSDREAIKRLFSKASLDAFSRQESRPVCIECSGLWLAIYRKNKRVAPENMAQFLEQCVQLKEALTGKRNG